MKKIWLTLLLVVSVMATGASEGREVQRIDSPDVVQSDFPSIAVDQSRPSRIQALDRDPQNPDPDPGMGGGGSDLCSGGATDTFHNKVCRADDWGGYYCLAVTDTRVCKAVTNQSGLITKCKTCF
jgi:hypothetical protein